MNENTWELEVNWLGHHRNGVPVKFNAPANAEQVEIEIETMKPPPGRSIQFKVVSE